MLGCVLLQGSVLGTAFCKKGQDHICYGSGEAGMPSMKEEMAWGHGDWLRSLCVCVVLGIEPKSLCMLYLHSATRTTPSLCLPLKLLGLQA
jgi:hypothetical protein